MEIFALIFEIVIPPIIIPLVMIIAGASFMTALRKKSTKFTVIAPRCP